MKKILFFSGSNNLHSINQQLVRYAAGLVSAAETQVIDLRDYALPIYGSEFQKEHGIPANARALHSLFSGYDAFTIAVPEHNWSVPAFFKNTIDWLSVTGDEVRFFSEKPVLLLSTTPGKGGGYRALLHAAEIVKALGGVVTGTFSLPGFRYAAGMHEGIFKIKDEQVRNNLEEMIKELENRIT